MTDEKEKNISMLRKQLEKKSPAQIRRIKKYVPVILSVISFVISYYLLLSLVASFRLLTNSVRVETDGSYLSLIKASFGESVIGGTLIFLIALGIGFAVNWFIESKEERIPDELGRKKSKVATGYDAGFLKDDDLRKLFNVTPYNKPNGIVIAKHKDTGEAISIPWEDNKDWLYQLNRHMMVFGGSGTGKTASTIIPCVYQNLMKGLSQVIIDAKGGELFRETYPAARYLGYNIKVFNIKGTEFRHSNGLDCLKMIRESHSPQAEAELFTSVIFSNTAGEPGHDTYWYEAERNLFKAIVLYVAWSPHFDAHANNRKPNSTGNYRTMDAVYDLICMEEKDLIQEISKSIDQAHINNETDYIREPFSVWAGNEKKGQVRTGLGTRLAIFQNKEATGIMSEDEIDFKELTDSKTIIYIVTNDRPNPYKFLLSLFINFLVNKVCDIADSRPAGKLDRPLYFVLDEFKAIGELPDWGDTLATVRARNIGIMMCMQTIGQLKDLYGYKRNGQNEWNTIITNCDVLLCLGSMDPLTTKFFRERAGTMTQEVTQISKEVSSISPIKWAPTERIQTGLKDVPLLDEHAISLIKKDRILICPAAYDVTIQGRYFYKDHPLNNLYVLNEHNEITVRLASEYIPPWVIKKEKEEKAMITGQEEIETSLPSHDAILNIVYIPPEKIGRYKRAAVAPAEPETKDNNCKQRTCNDISRFAQIEKAKPEGCEKEISFPKNDSSNTQATLHEAADDSGIYTYDKYLEELDESSDCETEEIKETDSDKEYMMYDEFNDDDL